MPTDLSNEVGKRQVMGSLPVGRDALTKPYRYLAY